MLCHFGVPRIDTLDWSLSIDGLVGRKKRLTFGDIVRRPRPDREHPPMLRQPDETRDADAARLQCDVRRFVQLADLLAECGPDPAAHYVWASGADYGVFEGDGCNAFVKDLPIDRISEDVLIAYEMNGAPLRPENGYPMRLVVPGYYGTNNVKWLTRLTLAERADVCVGP